MSNKLKNGILNTLEKLYNNNIKLEKQLFALSAKEEEQKLYNDLLDQQKIMFKEITILNQQEDNLKKKEQEMIKKEEKISKKEKKMEEKEQELKEKEKRITEKEKLKKQQEKEEEKKQKRKKVIKNILENTLQKPKEVEPKKLFENISKLGKALKDEMQEELKQNPDKFVNVNQALNSSNSKFFPSAVLANNLQKEGILTLVEKDAKPSPLHDVSLRFILNGVINQKKIIVGYTFSGIKFARSKYGTYTNINVTEDGNILTIDNEKNIIILSGSDLTKLYIYEGDLKEIKCTNWIQYDCFMRKEEENMSKILTYFTEQKDGFYIKTLSLSEK